MKIRIVSFLVLLLCAVGVVAQPSLPKPKRIYITMDVSVSMRGNKYVMANYAAQSLTVFSNPQDQICVYYLGKRHPLEGARDYKKLQIPYGNHNGRATYFEISDLVQFLKDYQPDSKYQDWLFIIGDGDWNYGSAKGVFDKTTSKLSDFISAGSLQVCYLQTGNTLNEEYDFTRFLNEQSSSVADIRKSDTTAVSVLDNCIYFANKILGFSNSSVQLHQSGSKTITFSSEFPLERCLLVYQSDQMSTGEVRIASAKCHGLQISSRVRGNPTTKPLVSPGAPALNGMVWELESSQTIPANDTVEIRFEQEIDVNRMTLYPYVDVSLRMRPWSVMMDELEEPTPDFFKICDREDSVLVIISATDKLGHKFPPPLMQRMDVVFSVEGNDVEASFSETDTTFRVVIPMPNDTISYLSKVECPGYFHRVSALQTVAKDASVCPPERQPLITLSPQRFSSIDFSTIREGSSFGGQINDTLFNVIAPLGTFDKQTIEETSEFGYFGHVQFTYGSNGTLTFTYTPSSDWCECAFPDTLTYLVTLRSTGGVLYDGKLYDGFIVPVSVPMDHRPWLVRCKIYLIALVALFLALIYFIALLKKNRFHKGARFRNSYCTEDSRKEKETNGKRLRKPGFGPWLSRWLNPFGDERSNISFVRPKTGAMTFVSSNSKNRILMTESSFNPKTMTVPNYTPQPKEKKSKAGPPVSISSGTSIEIKKTIGSETTRLGHLKYVVEGKDDEGGFRLFIGLLMLADVALMAFVAFILLKSL